MPSQSAAPAAATTRPPTLPLSTEATTEQLNQVRDLMWQLYRDGKFQAVSELVVPLISQALVVRAWGLYRSKSAPESNRPDDVQPQPQPQSPTQKGGALGVRELLPEVWQQVQGALDALGSLFMADEQAAVVAVLTPCISSLQLVQGWCFYRHKQYEEAFVFATSEPASQGKLELLAYLYAYSQSPYRNEKKLLEIVDQFPDKSVNGYNALVIAARDKGTSLVRDAVWNRLDQWVDQLNLNGATLEAAHLLHNLARLADEQGCFEKALAIIDKAIRAYGTESNWHHRGAAHFWRSKFLEKLGRPSDAWLAARDATAARAEQLRLEPANSVWKKDLEAARKHAWKVFSRVPLGATRFNPNPWPPLSS